MTQKIEDALRALEKIDPKPGCPVTEEQMTEYEQACSVFIILYYEVLREALQTLRGEKLNVETIEELFEKVPYEQILSLHKLSTTLYEAVIVNRNHERICGKISIIATGPTPQAAIKSALEKIGV